MEIDCPCRIDDILDGPNDHYTAPCSPIYNPLPNQLHGFNVASIIRSVSPASQIHCRRLSAPPTNQELRLIPSVAVVSASFYYFSNEKGYTRYDYLWDDFIYNEGKLLVTSAGNTGRAGGYVTTPSRGLNSLTVGNYNDANNTIAASSSWKDPENTGNTKPEVCAPGTDINAGYYYDQRENRHEITMSGTSMAAPHVAGIVANLVGVYPALRKRPHLQKAFIMGGAYDSIGGGSDHTGYGGVDMKESLYGAHYWWWEGGNNSFSWFDSRDRLPNNGHIDAYYYLRSDKKTRIVLTWLNRGKWTNDNLNNIHPIGMDLDFAVYDPKGRYVGGSYSWDNGFEVFKLYHQNQENIVFQLLDLLIEIHYRNLGWH